MTEEESSEYNRRILILTAGAKAQAALAQSNYTTELSQKRKELNSAQAQLKQTEKNLARAKKQAEKDALKARMADYRNRMNALNKSQTTSSQKAPILSGNRRTEK